MGLRKPTLDELNRIKMDPYRGLSYTPEQPVVEPELGYQTATGMEPTAENVAMELQNQAQEQRDLDSMSPQQQQSLMDQLALQQQQKIEASKPYLEAQEQELKDAQGIANQLKNQPRQIDLSPLMLAFGGTPEEVAALKPKETEGERLSRALIAAKEILGQRTNLLKQVGEIYGGKDITKQFGTQSRNDRAVLAKFGQDIKQDTSKTFNNFSDTVSNINELERTYDTGDIKQIKSSAGKMARAMGNKGATSDNDAERQYYKTLETELTDIAARLGGDPIVNKEVLKSYTELLKRSKESAKDLYKTQIRGSRSWANAQAEAVGMGDSMSDKGVWGRYYNEKEAAIDSFDRAKEKKEEKQKSISVKAPQKITEETPVPTGMKRQQNPKTGAYRFVPNK